MRTGGGPNIQMVVQFTPVVKKLVILNVLIYVGLIVIVQNLFLAEPYFFKWFGLIPRDFLYSFFIWQPFTYMFFHHAQDIFHIVFNMLMLWWLGSELEARWGSRFFLTYYMVSGVGAGLIYVGGLVIYALATGNSYPMEIPVIGASGSIFGLFLAYGIVYGERVIYFMMVFPMKAKFFVLILGAIEVVSLLNSGFTGRVANLAHLGGVVAGFLFLMGWTRWQGRRRRRAQKHGRRLKLVVDNERKDENQGNGPKYWN